MKKENMAIACLKTGTISADTTKLTTANVFAKIVAEVKNMKKRNMKVSSMRVAISADVEELLLTDEKFSNTSGSLGEKLVREGVIGKIAGVPTKANYLMGDDVDFIIYDKRYCQKYEVWKKEPSIEDIKDGKHICASALQGRQVGGLMVTNKLGVQVRMNKELETYTVTYNANGGTGSIDSVEVEAGKSITLSDGTGLTVPTGKTFKGWAKSASATNTTVTSPFTPTADTTLYAVYGE